MAIAIFDYVRETNLNLGTDFKSSGELWSYARLASDRLTRQWIDSGRTDYSIYKDPDYVYEGLLCYHFISKHCLLVVERFHRAFGIEKGTLLDIYNGVGLTSVYAALCGFDVTVVNDNPAQVEFMQKTAKRHLGRELKVCSTLPSQTFDTVCSFEVLEHFTHPLDELERQLGCVTETGIFAESTGFLDSGLLGHFETYSVGADVIQHRKVSRLVQKRLERDARVEAFGIQNKPRVWNKNPNLDENPKKWVVPKNGKRELFRGYVRQMQDLGLEADVVGPLAY